MMEIICGCLLIPCAICLLGLLMWKIPLKRNAWIGWRTPIALKSEENFERINKYAGKKLTLFGTTMLLFWVVVGIILICMKVDSFASFFIVTLQVVLVLIAVWRIDKGIKRKVDL